MMEMLREVLTKALRNVVAVFVLAVLAILNRMMELVEIS